HLALRSFPTRRSSDLMRRAWKSVQFEHEEISRYVCCEGSQTSRSNVLAAEKPMSPVHSSTRRYGSPSLSSTTSAQRVIRSCSSQDRKSTRLNSSHVKT